MDPYFEIRDHIEEWKKEAEEGADKRYEADLKTYRGSGQMGEKEEGRAPRGPNAKLIRIPPERTTRRNVQRDDPSHCPAIHP